MKRAFKISIISFLIVFQTICTTSCKKDSSESQNPQQTGNTGQVVFWVSEDVGYISITVDGVNEGTIKGYYYGGEPDCGDTKCLTLTLSGGSHSYTASGNIGTKTKSFTVISNTCTDVKVFGD